MTRILDRIAEISDGYDALFVDLWGCYHNGVEPYAAAVEALRRYRQGGGRVVLLTNAPRPAGSVRQFLDRMGAPADSYDGIMSSGSACQRALASGTWGHRFHYVGPDRDRHILGDIGLADHPLDEAEALVCTGAIDDHVDPRIGYAEAVPAWLDRGLTMLCANPDIVVDRGDQRLWCAGALASFYETSGGEVVWFGKPHAPTYEQTFALLHEIAGDAVPRERVLAIGDGIATDIRGAVGYGLDTVFVTGGLAAEDTDTGAGTDAGPDPERLEAFLAGAGLRPSYAMGYLR